jgi:disulfide bond formation protein DsbB
MKSLPLLRGTGVLLLCLWTAGCQPQTTPAASPAPFAQTPTAVAATSSAPAASAAVKAGDAAAGKKTFGVTCTACHGDNAKGIKGVGKDLTTSAFVKAQNDEQLLAFIIKGRDANDPANTTHVAMPPKGGNMQATDQDLMNVVAYLRTLQK